MYYLTFLLPEVATALERNGFTVQVEALASFKQAKLVIATRRSSGTPASQLGASMP